MDPKGILSLLLFFQSDHCKFDYIFITLYCYYSNNIKNSNEKKRDELNNEHKVMYTKDSHIFHTL